MLLKPFIKCLMLVKDCNINLRLTARGITINWISIPTKGGGGGTKYSKGVSGFNSLPPGIACHGAEGKGLFYSYTLVEGRSSGKIFTPSTEHMFSDT